MVGLWQLLILAASAVGSSFGDSGKLAFTLNNDGSYSFAAGGNHNFNLTSGDAFLQANKMPYSTKDKSLKLSEHSDLAGTDEMGSYVGKSFTYVGGEARVYYQVMVYQGGEFVRFKQGFPSSIANTNVSSHDAVVSGFPNFKTDQGTSQVGYLNMFDNMCGYFYAIGNFSADKFLRGGQRAGPLVLFDRMGNVMVLSAFSNFMAHNMMFDSTDMQLHFGIMGGVTSVPSFYEMDTILYFGDNGINQAIEDWGRVLTKRYGKTNEIRENDFTVQYLGYWTDNGAYYYYQEEQNKTYEETILDVLKYASGAGIPYRYIQYDSWWYYKGVLGGVKNWTAKSDVFPNGMEYLFKQHGLPVSAHNRYWASDTDYAKQNGGKYNFVVEETKAIPIDNEFWSDLLHNSSAWGLITYEQDWLDREFELMKVTHTDINIGRNWLLQMGRGAAEHRMTIQYCMALSRHMLQSVEIPAVTQIRVSSDYQPGNDQWKIGITSMFANALNLAPFKDTFWTTSHQNGSQYNNDEKYPALQAAIATLSTGPVGPSDSIGMTSNIIHQSCRADGLILKPSRPITTIDKHIVNTAFPSLVKTGSANVDAQVYSTYTDVLYSSQTGRHGIILVTDLTTVFQATAEMMYLDAKGSYVAYNGHPGNDPQVYVIGPEKNHTIPKCGRSDFQMWYFAPIFNIGGSQAAVLGERGKWVPVSSQRIKSIEVQTHDLIVHVEGYPGESIQFGFYSSGSEDLHVVYAYCSFGTSGKLKIHYATQLCENE